MIDGKKCIGVLTSGGDAPGMNVAIRSVVRTALHNDIIPMGVVRGYNGLLEKNFRIMEFTSVSNILKKAGRSCLPPDVRNFTRQNTGNRRTKMQWKPA